MSLFITLEGIEGCGKTTQVKSLEEHLSGKGFQVVTTREPGGCSISDALRTVLLNPANTSITAKTELLLYEAARAQHIEEVIRPALKRNSIVLCDRFSDATSVYQGTGRGLDPRMLEAVNRFSTGGITPDLTLLLDLPVEESLGRARERNDSDNLTTESRFELESLAFHRRIRQGYLELAERNDRIRLVDAHGSQEVVSQRVFTVVDDFLATRRSA